MQRKLTFSVGGFYHLYNRGNDKKTFFLDENDYKRFIALLYLCNTPDSVDMRRLKSYEGRSFVELFSVKKREALVDIGAYCLMPNHFHILLYEKEEGGTTKFMKKLSTGYSMYFNIKYDRSGGLFEGRFKAKHIDNNPYFNYVFSYIHLNPVKLIESNWQETGISDRVSAEKFMKGYGYSSYRDYFSGERPETAILNKSAFPEHFSKLNDFEDIIRFTKDRPSEAVKTKEI